MMTAKRIEYEIGYDRYKRTTRLIAERDGGNTYWSIVSEPVSQRDDGERMSSLTSDQLLEAGEIVRRLRRNQA